MIQNTQSHLLALRSCTRHTDMPAIRVTGKTWIYRERLKEMGGRYDSDARLWRFKYASKSDITQIRMMPGCIVTEEEPETAEDFISRIRDEPATTGTRQTVFYGDCQEYYNRFRDKNPLSFLGFSSLSGFVRFIENIPDSKRRDAGWETDAFYARFTGTRDMAHAINLARNGWREGAERAEEVARMLTVAHALQRRRKHSVAGGSVNVGRLLAGNPAHMISRPKQPGRKVITLFVGNNGLANITVSSMVLRAAVCCAIVDLLEANGYSCELISVTTDRTGGIRDVPGDQLTVRLKSAGERVNIADIAFALGHPSFFRRFGFAAIRQADELQSMWQTMGRSVVAFDADTTEHYIPHLTRNYKDDEIKQMIADITPANLPLEIET